jgi:hypothetical protein
MAVKSMDKRLDGGLVEMPDVGCDLARLLIEQEQLGIDEAKCIDDHFALDTLDGVDHNSDSSRIELLKALWMSK